MTPQAAKVEQALIALAPEERVAVVHNALLSLDGGSEDSGVDDINGAWNEQIGHRLDDVLEGRVELGSFEATRARFEDKYPASAR